MVAAEAHAPEDVSQGAAGGGSLAADHVASGRPPAGTFAEDDHAGRPEGGGEEEDGGEVPGPEELRRRWLDEVALVKRLAKQGMPEEHPALAAAYAARDAAEAAWRSAKQPAPVATRLRWAQEKLNRAVELQAATRAAVEQAECEHRKLMAQLQERLDADRDRVSKRRLAVEELQEEISADLPAGRAKGGMSAAVLEACGGLCNSVGHELAALVELLPDGSAEQQAANKALATLAESQRRVEAAVGHDGRCPQSPQSFDIGDDDRGVEAMSEASAWSESHELGASGDAPGNPVEAGQASAHNKCGGGTAGRSDGHGADNWHRWDETKWHTPHWQTDRHGRWRRATWADQWEEEYTQGDGWATGHQASSAHGTRRGGGEHDEDTGEPSAKFRRQQASGHAMDVECADAPTVGAGASAGAHAAAAAAAAAPGTPIAGVASAATYERQVAEVVERAISMGVQPLSDDGEELVTLSPELLSRWVATHLEHKVGG